MSESEPPTEDGEKAVTFAGLALCRPIKRALREQGYEKPTPIQAQAIPHLIEGRDLLGIAQTGTGKTAAFALPIIDFNRIGDNPNPPRAACARASLVLTPTRELAAQIGESFKVYGKLRRTCQLRGRVRRRRARSPQVQARCAAASTCSSRPRAD